MIFASGPENARYYERTMRYSEEAGHSETCLAIKVAAEAADIQAELDDIRGVVEAIPGASEGFPVLATEGQGGEVGGNSLTQIELDGREQKVFDESVEGR